ncbi:helix-turn-helix transcriptional regulator [Brucella anthropi]|nr:helix-turn-helix transcriptional regulator [Brucella pituitosa]KAB2739381.1 helix-turn-helix transcriptional regulator [Brucella anthropi]KAB2753507.1 helix-turn-helix transcriptional regulator [Brucella anthropi]KAB2783587.1 helix-turn-helix transcriptional regulator [Brucella anthropi]SUA64677.1 transcriptional regulator, y4mF family [Brucella anthropi]
MPLLKGRVQPDLNTAKNQMFEKEKIMTSVKIDVQERHPAGFKSRRETLGLTQEELAASAGISVQELDSLENTPANSGSYNFANAVKVEQALAQAEPK